MSNYIVCQKKRNNPRMDVRICQKKCDLKAECNDYIDFHKLNGIETGLNPLSDAHLIQKKAA